MHFENIKYLKIFAAISMTECDEIINLMDIVSARKTNTIATNLTSTDLTNCQRKRYFIGNHITVGNYYYLLLSYKTRRYNIKRKRMKLKKFVLKIIRVISSTI